MPDVDGTEAQARHLQDDIERTRQEMDDTLTALERKLSPSEMLHSGAETVRESVRGSAAGVVETLKQHPWHVALAVGLVGARLAFRPSAAERHRRETEQDLERAMAVLGTAFERAQDRAQTGASRLAGLVRDAIDHPDRYATPARQAAERLFHRATAETRVVGSTLRREAGTNPLGTLVLFGLAAGVAALANRTVRGRRYAP